MKVIKPLTAFHKGGSDLHLANFSCANGRFCWRVLSFQSACKDNEIWINWKVPIFCLLKAISFLIVTKSSENLYLLWLETLHFHGFSKILFFSMTNSEVISLVCFLKMKINIKFCSQYVRILFTFLILTPSFEITRSKIQTISVVLNLF